MFQRIFFWWMVFFIYPFGVFSQSIFYNSPVSLGMGATGVAQSDDVWSVVHNPAGTANLNKIGLAIGYYLPYFTNELSSKSVIAALPTSFGVVSVDLNHYGFQLYQENRIVLNYANNISPGLCAAFQLKFQNNHLSQSGSGSQLYSGFGLNYQPNEDLVFGFYLSNPEKAKLAIHNEFMEIPSVYMIGLNWEASESFIISTEMEKQVGFDSLVKIGMEYNIKNEIWIRSGVFGKPINYTFGLGFKMYGFKLDVALMHHQVLGISSSIGLLFQIPEK